MTTMLIILALWILTLPVTSWVLYVALMHMDKLHAEGILDPEAQVWGERILLVGYLFDVGLNWTWAGFYFKSVPREWTVTAHLNRLVATGTPEQKATALRFRAKWLNNFDRRGIHT